MTLAAVALLGSLIVFGAGLYIRQTLLFPRPDGVHGIADVDVAGIEGLASTTVTAADGTPIELWRAGSADGRPLVLLFHGNGEVNAFTADRMALALGAGYAVAAMEYRGYNGNPGSPSEAALIADAEDVMDALERQGIAPERIVLWGYSMGTGLAVPLAADRRVRGLVLEAPFLSIVDVAQERFPGLPVGLFLRDRFLSRDAAPEVEAPTLVLSGAEDGVFSSDHGRRLASLIAGAQFTELAGVGHYGIAEDGEGVRLIRDFLAAHLAPPP